MGRTFPWANTMREEAWGIVTQSAPGKNFSFFPSFLFEFSDLGGVIERVVDLLAYLDFRPLWYL